MEDDRAWLDKRDGKIYIFPTEILGIAEESAQGSDFSEYPPLQRWQIKEAIDFLERWDRESLVNLPNKDELSEYDIMEEFAEFQHTTHVSNLLLGAIQGRGAFRRFRDAIAGLGLKEEWYAYREESMLEKVRRWCEYNELDYVNANDEVVIFEKTLSAMPAMDSLDEIPAADAEETPAEPELTPELKTPRIRYTAEEKETALWFCDEIGVAKTSELTGISAKSLYKWLSIAKGDSEEVSGEEVKALTSVELKFCTEKDAEVDAGDELVQLRLENEKLKEEMAALKKAIRAYTD